MPFAESRAALMVAPSFHAWPSTWLSAYAKELQLPWKMAKVSTQPGGVVLSTQVPRLAPRGSDSSTKTAASVDGVTSLNFRHGVVPVQPPPFMPSVLE